jgi:hypothetical protein
LASVQELKQYKRIATRQGTKENWEEVEMLGTTLSVRIISHKDVRVLSYSAYFSAEMLPSGKQININLF